MLALFNSYKLWGVGEEGKSAEGERILDRRNHTYPLALEFPLTHHQVMDW